MQTEAEIAARDVAGAQKFFDDAVDGGSGNGEAGDAGQGAGGDAENTSRGIDDGGAGAIGIEGEIEAKLLIDLAAAPGAPGSADRAHDAHGGVDAGIRGSAD